MAPSLIGRVAGAWRSGVSGGHFRRGSGDARRQARAKNRDRRSGAGADAARTGKPSRETQPIVAAKMIYFARCPQSLGASLASDRRHGTRASGTGPNETGTKFRRTEDRLLGSQTESNSQPARRPQTPYFPGDSAIPPPVRPIGGERAPTARRRNASAHRTRRPKPPPDAVCRARAPPEGLLSAPPAPSTKGRLAAARPGGAPPAPVVAVDARRRFALLPEAAKILDGARGSAIPFADETSRPGAVAPGGFRSRRRCAVRAPGGHDEGFPCPLRRRPLSIPRPL